MNSNVTEIAGRVESDGPESPSPAADAETHAVAGRSAAPAAGFRRILVAVDESDAAAWAAEAGAALAEALSAQLAIVHVVDVTPLLEGAMMLPERLREDLCLAGDALLREQRSHLPKKLQEQVESIRLEGLPGAELVAAARRWKPDLIVMGSHARGRVAHLLLGSVTRHVIRFAPCPVVVVAHPMPASTAYA